MIHTLPKEHPGLVLAGIATASLAVLLIVKERRKARSRKATRFLGELERLLVPAVAVNSLPALDIRYWEQKPDMKLSAEAAKSHAQSIADAWGTWYWPNDDEAKIYAVFRALRNQAQVSQVAHAYYEQTQVNLMDDLRARLDADELRQVLGIIQALPQ